MSIFSHEIPGLIDLHSPESSRISPDPSLCSSIDPKKKLAFPFLHVVSDHSVGGHSTTN